MKRLFALLLVTTLVLAAAITPAAANSARTYWTGVDAGEEVAGTMREESRQSMTFRDRAAGQVSCLSLRS